MCTLPTDWTNGIRIPLVFQSHSEIMLKMLKLRFPNGIKLRILSESQISSCLISFGRCCPVMFNDSCHLLFIWSLHNITIVQDNCESVYSQSAMVFQKNTKNELIVLSFPQNLSKLAFQSSMVINLWECGIDRYWEVLRRICPALIFIDIINRHWYQ